MTDKDENVLSRWSRLKRESAEKCSDAGTTAEPDDFAPIDGKARPGHDGVQPIGNEGEALLTAEDLPDIDSLTYDSDFSMFLQSNVPQYLHNLAMHKLWRSDPVLANVDGLNDYDLDYTIEEAMDVAIQSAEDLARGSKRLNMSDVRSKDREARELARRKSVYAEANPDVEADPPPDDPDIIASAAGENAGDFAPPEQDPAISGHHEKVPHG